MAKAKRAKAPPKTAGESVDNSPVAVGEMIPQPHGGALRNGNPGNKGGTGRPPNAFRAQVAAISDRMKLPEIMGKIAAGQERVIETDEGEVAIALTKDTDRIAATKLLWSYAHGQPAQSVDVTSGGETLPQVVVIGGITVNF